MKKILLVDDDPAIVQYLVELLKHEGWAISTAGSGIEGLEKLSNQRYDLVVSDVWMPAMTGLEMLAEMRKLPQYPPAIVMTGDDTPAVTLKALAHQAQMLVTKPFKAGEMLTVIRQAIQAPSDSTIQVISATPDWVEIEIPCELKHVDQISSLMLKLKSDLPETVRESVGQAFRELLLNAVEWGGELDAERRVRISFVRAKRMLLYRIADPGKGFNFESLAHAAVANAPDDPIGHMRVREERGLRPGGLGILMTKSLVDELLYNEKQNEVVFVKYLD